MPAITISDGRGLLQGGQGSLGVTVKTHGLKQVLWSETTDITAVGANDVEMTLTQPANTVLVDVGWVFDTTEIAGSSGNSKLKVGVTDDGAELVALTDIMSGGTATAAGSGISLSGLRSEGDAALALVNEAPCWTSANRTIYIRMENSAVITAGEGRSWITYTRLPQ
tara:strand:+ start:1148 stop:1648 length:501 start_codon:yes stop_codon:yes gene_type:complete